MERREDGCAQHRSAYEMSLVDQGSQRVWPGVRRAGLPRQSPGADAGPGAAQRRRLI
jgi:hypothetical protein